MQSLVTATAPAGFRVTTPLDNLLVIERRRIGPRWFMRTFYALFTVWLLGWILTGIFLSYQATAASKVPLWLAALWWISGIIGFRYVFGYALWRLRSVTSYTFSEDELLVENTFLTRRTRRKVARREVRAVRQVYDGGQVDGLVTHSWGLVVEAPDKLALFAHEGFETSAWLGPIVARWAQVTYESSRTHNDQTA